MFWLLPKLIHREREEEQKDHRKIRKEVCTKHKSQSNGPVTVVDDRGMQLQFPTCTMSNLLSDCKHLTELTLMLISNNTQGNVHSKSKSEFDLQLSSVLKS